jgi:AbrB family looped-hinge helix DNA binding protein
MRITSKGQVTIPQDIRERIGLLPDTEVEFEVVGNAVKFRKARHSRARGRALVAGYYRREALPWDAAFLAGKVFLRYRQAGGAAIAR